MNDAMTLSREELGDTLLCIRRDMKDTQETIEPLIYYLGVAELS